MDHLVDAALRRVVLDVDRRDIDPGASAQPVRRQPVQLLGSLQQHDVDIELVAASVSVTSTAAAGHVHVRARPRPHGERSRSTGT